MTVDFQTFANNMNSKFPDVTTTIEQKKTAIEAKKAIMNHPDCPIEIKTKLQQEIQKIQKEIGNMSEKEQATKNKKNSESIFVAKQDNTNTVQ